MAYKDSVNALNPVAYYRLGDTSGTVVTDETGNHHGTYVNSPTLGVAGLLTHDNDTAVGISSGVEIHSNVGVPASGFSVSFLVKINTHINLGAPVSLQASNQYKCLPMLYSSALGYYRSFIVTTTGTKAYQIPVTFNLGETYHIVSTAEGGFYKVWVNGTEVLSEAITGNLVATDNLLVNGFNNSNHVFDGTIDEVAIFGTALTPQEALELYTASITAPTTPTTFPDYVNALNPVAYYRLGESSGTTAIDETGNYDGTYQNAPTLGATGLLVNDSNTAVVFDGTNDYVLSDTAIPKNDIKSVSAIFNNIDVSGTHHHGILSSGDGVSATTWMIYKAPDGYLKVYIGSANAVILVSDNLIVENTTYHVVLQWDGTELSMYLNGTKQSDTHNGNIFLSPTNDAKISIGTYYYNGGYGANDSLFKGTLDEVLVFDTALTEEEILTLYALSRIPSANYLSHSAYTQQLSAVSSHYKLNEASGASGTTIVDGKGSNDGSIVGTLVPSAAGLIESGSGKCLDFTGTGHIELPVQPYVGFHLTFTVDDISDHRGLFGVGDSGINRELLYIAISLNQLRYYRRTGGSGDTTVCESNGAGSIIAGQTYSVTVQYDGTDTSMFLNGVKQDLSTAGNHLTIQNLPPHIGTFRTSTGSLTTNRHDGKIDEVILLDTALTDTQIKTLYIASKIDLTSLIAESTKKVTITIVESQAVDHWTAVALDYTTQEVVHWQELGDAGAHDVLIPETVTDPYVLLIIPYVGDVWDSQAAKSVGDLVFPTDTQTTPHFYKCKTAGSTSSVEPTWTINAGDIIDGAVLWEYVGIIPEGLAHYPVTTLPS